MYESTFGGWRGLAADVLPQRRDRNRQEAWKSTRIQIFPIPVHRVYLDVYPERGGIGWAARDFSWGCHFGEGEMFTQRNASQITKALKAVQKAAFGAFCFSISEELCGCEKVGKVVNFPLNLPKRELLRAKRRKRRTT